MFLLFHFLKWKIKNIQYGKPSTNHNGAKYSILVRIDLWNVPLLKDEEVYLSRNILHLIYLSVKLGCINLYLEECVKKVKHMQNNTCTTTTSPHVAMNNK